MIKFYVKNKQIYIQHLIIQNPILNINNNNNYNHFIQFTNRQHNYINNSSMIPKEQANVTLKSLQDITGLYISNTVRNILIISDLVCILSLYLDINNIYTLSIIKSIWCILYNIIYKFIVFNFNNTLLFLSFIIYLLSIFIYYYINIIIYNCIFDTSAIFVYNYFVNSQFYLLSIHSNIKCLSIQLYIFKYIHHQIIFILIILHIIKSYYNWSDLFYILSNCIHQQHLFIITVGCNINRAFLVYNHFVNSHVYLVLNSVLQIYSNYYNLFVTIIYILSKYIDFRYTILLLFNTYHSFRFNIRVKKINQQFIDDDMDFNNVLRNVWNAILIHTYEFVRLFLVVVHIQLLILKNYYYCSRLESSLRIIRNI